MRFQVVTAANMKMMACVMVPCSLVEVDRRFWGAIHHPDGGSSQHLWNVGLLQRDSMAPYPRRLSSSKEHSVTVEKTTVNIFTTVRTSSQGFKVADSLLGCGIV
jgi:hypothetical protein